MTSASAFDLGSGAFDAVPPPPAGALTMAPAVSSPSPTTAGHSQSGGRTFDFGIGEVNFLDGWAKQLGAADDDVVVRLTLHHMTVEDVVLLLVAFFPFCYGLAAVVRALFDWWRTLADKAKQDERALDFAAQANLVAGEPLNGRESMESALKSGNHLPAPHGLPPPRNGSPASRNSMLAPLRPEHMLARARSSLAAAQRVGCWEALCQCCSGLICCSICSQIFGKMLRGRKYSFRDGTSCRNSSANGSSTSTSVRCRAPRRSPSSRSARRTRGPAHRAI
jgi:hypothetical protein